MRDLNRTCSSIPESAPLRQHTPRSSHNPAQDVDLGVKAAEIVFRVTRSEPLSISTRERRLLRYLTGVSRPPGSLLRGEREETYRETCGGLKITQLPEFLFTLAGQPAEDRRSQYSVRALARIFPSRVSSSDFVVRLFMLGVSNIDVLYRKTKYLVSRPPAMTSKSRPGSHRYAVSPTDASSRSLLRNFEREDLSRRSRPYRVTSCAIRITLFRLVRPASPRTHSSLPR